MASSVEKARMPDLSLEEIASIIADFPDLNDVNGADLRKPSQSQFSAKEHQGALYKGFYRQLQISPALYDRFYLHVLRPTRNKHIDDLKRGTPASVKLLTDLLLRGFGYIVWDAGLSWLLPDDQLDEGEERLIYVRGQGHDNPHNARFYPVFGTLWRRMRSIIFEVKPEPRKRGGNTRGARRSISVDTETDTAYLGDTDTHGFASPLPSYYRPAATADLRARVLATRLSYETQNRKTMLSRGEAGAAIQDLIRQVAEIRACTDPRVFEELWERHIGRLEELDCPFGIAKGDQDASNSETNPPEESTSDPKPSAPRAVSSEPFVSKGNPIPPQMPLSALVPATPPSHMSIWISTCGILPTTSLYSVPLITASTIYSAHSSAGATSSTCSPAYHWPNAPVQNSDLAPFFLGMNARVDPPTSSILGWLLSYGWNDRCRFISSGLTDVGNNEPTEENSDAQSGEVDADAEATDDDDHAPPPPPPPSPTLSADLFDPKDSNLSIDPPSNPVVRPTTAAAEAASIAEQNADFDEEQWASIKLGWRDFQYDLREAARMGVRVWRIKVCVLNLTR